MIKRPFKLFTQKTGIYLNVALLYRTFVKEEYPDVIGIWQQS